MTPGQKIVDEAFAAYEAFLQKYAEDLEEIKITVRPIVYSYWCDGVGIDNAKIMAELED